MTTRPKALRYRTRRSMPLSGAPGAEAADLSDQVTGGPADPAIPIPDSSALTDPAALLDAAGPAHETAVQELEAIRREGLTGRQLRMARRVAQKHGLAVTSDFDAVMQLRARGIDPFQTSQILELVQPAGDQKPAGRVQLPQTVPVGAGLPSTERALPNPESAAGRRVDEIMKIQRDIAKRRRRKLALLFARLAVFVLLPTLVVGYYFFNQATPMFGTKSEFVIQQSQNQGAAGGLGGLFQGTQLATNQDSMTVQAYLSSRAAMLRLDQEEGFRAHFSQDDIDAIQRLPAGASNEEAYKLYQSHVIIAYDPTEGVLKMEVIAADPETSQRFSEALIRYAEEQVDQLSLRLREDQMGDARTSYEEAEQRRAEALARWLQIQQDVEIADPTGETAARTAQISALEVERQQLQLQLDQLQSVARPNQARVEDVRSQIGSRESLIANLRAQMTEGGAAGGSLAAKNTELRLAEENYTFQTLMVQQALTQMETARLEANRQVRYLETGVAPVAPDEATYPRAFENTLLAFLVFAGIYLMLSLTVSILREQVTS